MKIKVDTEKRILRINDGLKLHFGFLKAIFILNILNSVVFLYKSYKTGYEDEFVIIWTILALISLGALFFIFGRSTKEVISFDEIDFAFKKRIFGSDRYFLKLKNTKIRNLPAVKSAEDALEWERIVKENNIKIKPDS